MGGCVCVGVSFRYECWMSKWSFSEYGLGFPSALSI